MAWGVFIGKSAPEPKAIDNKFWAGGQDAMKKY
jgi:hypothetical protein